jgi:hypothetical protein
MFAFSLAKELGMTVEHMLNNMTSEELCYWHAYSELEREEIEWIKMRGGK